MIRCAFFPEWPEQASALQSAAPALLWRLFVGACVGPISAWRSSNSLSSIQPARPGFRCTAQFEFADTLPMYHGTWSPPCPHAYLGAHPALRITIVALNTGDVTHERPCPFRSRSLTWPRLFRAATRLTPSAIPWRWRQHVERLGLQALLAGEHHNISGVASSAAAVLIGHVRQAIRRTLRGPGRAASWLPSHAPLVIAEQFGTLEIAVPGPYRLGAGPVRPAAMVPPSTRCAGGPAGSLEFPALVEELRGFLAASQPGQLVVRAIPGEGAGISSTIWLLGSSDFGARLAAELGLPFSFRGAFLAAGHGGNAACTGILCKPSATLARPYAMIRRARGGGRIRRGRLSANRPPKQLKFLSLVRWPSPAIAAAGPRVWTAYRNEWEREAVNQRQALPSWAEPDTVKRRLEALVAETEADEIMIVSDFFDIADRLRSFEYCHRP